MSNMNTRIEDGEFKSKLPYPMKPREPAILRKKINEVTDAEMATIPAVRAKYEADKVDYEDARRAYNVDSAQKEADFRNALEVEHGMVGHPKADKLFSLAWEYGHSYGHSEVSIHYDNLVELVK